MKIALAAYEFRNRDFAFNLSQIERGLREASGKAELLVFGEAFLQGFDALNWDYAHDLALAVSTDSAIFQKLKGWTSDYGIGLALGYIEQDGNDIYSSCAVIDQGALIHNYRRISRGWKEYWHTDEHYREGDQAEGFSFRCTANYIKETGNAQKLRFTLYITVICAAGKVERNAPAF